MPAADFPVVVRFPLQWGELDALGHANNARFFAWFEAARIALFLRVGIGTEPGTEVGAILAHTSCDYLKPVFFPSELEVGTRVSKIGRTSVEQEYEVSANGVVVARGRSVLVMVRYFTDEKVPVVDPLRSALEALR